jgi:hypothetical protein
MRVMGLGYVCVGLAAFLLPDPFLSRLFPRVDAATQGDSYLALRTTLTVWGAYVGLIGGAVLVGSRNPRRHVGLAGLVIATEAAGALGDVWLSTLGHVNAAVTVPGILLHLISVVLGVVFVWRSGSGGWKFLETRKA